MKSMSKLLLKHEYYISSSDGLCLLFVGVQSTQSILRGAAHITDSLQELRAIAEDLLFGRPSK